MALNSLIDRVTYDGNGSAVTPYPVPFAYLEDPNAVAVFRISGTAETPLVRGTDYALTSGGVVTAQAIPDTEKVFLLRSVQATQGTVYQENGRFPAKSHERALDKLTMLVQQLSGSLLRSLRLPESVAEAPPLPIPTSFPNLLGYGTDAAPRTYDLQQARTLLGLTGGGVSRGLKVFEDATQRAIAVPDYPGQVGILLVDGSLWVGGSPVAGAWTPNAVQASAGATANSDTLPASAALVQLIAAAAQAAALTAATPVGTIHPFAGATAPTGYLFADGRAVSRSTYAPLFAVIGTTYGAGDGSTTFGLPDLRGRVIAGRDTDGPGTFANRLTNSGTGNPGINAGTLGAAGGSDRHQLTVAQLAIHPHPAAGTGRFIMGNMPSGGTVGFTAGGNYQPTEEQLNTGSAGGDQAHPNAQPTLVLNYIIRAL